MWVCFFFFTPTQRVKKLRRRQLHLAGHRNWFSVRGISTRSCWDSELRWHSAHIIKGERRPSSQSTAPVPAGRDDLHREEPAWILICLLGFNSFLQSWSRRNLQNCDAFPSFHFNYPAEREDSQEIRMERRQRESKREGRAWECAWAGTLS